MRVSLWKRRSRHGQRLILRAGPTVSTRNALHHATRSVRRVRAESFPAPGIGFVNGEPNEDSDRLQEAAKPPGSLASSLLSDGRMDTALYAGVNAMNANEKRLDIIAANLGNMGVAGYKRHSLFSQALAKTNSTGQQSLHVSVGASIDFGQGQIDRTGSKLDVALDGEGFFVVDTQDGPAYTRGGRFHLDEGGILHTQDGQVVAWEGSPGRLKAVGDEITIDAGGRVRQGVDEVGRLRIVDFEKKSTLVPDGVGYFRAPSTSVTRTSTALVHQGALERANIEPIDELVGMIAAQRSFENATTLMRSLEQIYRRLNQPR